MRIIDKNDSKYPEVVQVSTDKKYKIHCSKLEPDDAVVCPFDKNMKVGKITSGDIKIMIKAVRYPFVVPPAIKKD